MSERVPPLEAMRAAFARCHPFPGLTEVDERLAEFDRRIAEVERAAAETAWTEGAHAQWRLGQERRLSAIPANPYRKTKEEHDD